MLGCIALLEETALFQDLHCDEINDVTTWGITNADITILNLSTSPKFASQ